MLHHGQNTPGDGIKKINKTSWNDVLFFYPIPWGIFYPFIATFNAGESQRNKIVLSLMLLQI